MIKFNIIMDYVYINECDKSKSIQFDLLYFYNFFQFTKFKTK